VTLYRGKSWADDLVQAAESRLAEPGRQNGP
jgi:hypothetical protein